MNTEENIPHSLTLEQAVIAGIMAESDGWDKVSNIITESDFFSSRHRVIFKAIHSLYTNNKPVDALIVSDWLKNNGLLSKAGGEEYLGVILRDSPATAENVAIHAERIRGQSIERKLLAVADSIRENIVTNNGKSTVELLEESERDILSISSHSEGLGSAIQVRGSVSVLDEVFGRMCEASDKPEGFLSGIKTGIKKIDEYTDGFQKKDLIFIGARPSMGKTTLGMNFVESALFNQPLPVVVFSMESPSYQIGQRLLSAVSKIPLFNIVRGKFSGTEFTQLNAATLRLKKTNMQLIDKGALAPSDMRTVLRRVVREFGGVGMIMADYAQKMQLKGDHKKNRNEELCIISSDLKEIAKEFDCPFICLAQLSKSCEQRPDKRPLMSDLRDCGGFEQDADIVMMLYRDEVYKKTAENAGLAEIIFRKNRNGAVDTVITRFNGSTFRFSDLDYGDYDE